MKRLIFLVFYFVFCNVMLFGVDSKNIESKLQIALSIEPLAFFVEQIAQDKANISVIVPSNKDAETYEPDFKMMSNLSRAKLIIGAGMPFESIWLDRIAAQNREIKILKLDKILQNTHDSHLWLSLKNAIIIADSITNELISLDSKNANFYRQNVTDLKAKIEKLRQDSKSILSSMKKPDFIVYHPLFEDFASEYGLREHSLQKHGKNYGLKDIVTLSNLGKKLGIKRIFTQSENKDISALARELNAQIVLINPMSRDYINNLRDIFRQISKSYE